MKLTNASDKKTDKLVQYGLFEQGIAVEGDLLLPGKSVDVDDADKDRVEAENAHLFEVGALVWGTEKNALVELKGEDVSEPSVKEAPSKKSK